MGWVIGSCLCGLGWLGLKVYRTGPIFFDLEHSLSLSRWRPWQKAMRSALIDIRHHHRRRWFSIDFPLSIPLSLSWLSFPVSLSLSITTQTPKTIQILKLTGRIWQGRNGFLGRQYTTIYDRMASQEGELREKSKRGWISSFFFSLSRVRDEPGVSWSCPTRVLSQFWRDHAT